MKRYAKTFIITYHPKQKWDFLAQIKIQTIYANKFPSLRTNQNHCISFFCVFFYLKTKNILKCRRQNLKLNNSCWRRHLRLPIEMEMYVHEKWASLRACIRTKICHTITIINCGQESGPRPSAPLLGLSDCKIMKY